MKDEPREGVSSLGRVAAEALRLNADRLQSARAVAAQGDAPEAIHDLRVALRILPFDRHAHSARELGASLRSAANSLGDVRDADVFLAWLAEWGDAAPVEFRDAAARWLASARDERRIAAQAGRAALQDPHWERLLNAIRSLADELLVDDDGHPKAAKAWRKIARREERKAARLARTESALPSPTLVHRLRIRVKRLRYLIELFRPWLGRRVVNLERLQSLQERLGAAHDADVAGSWIDRLAKRDRAERPNERAQIDPARAAAHTTLKRRRAEQLELAEPDLNWLRRRARRRRDRREE